MKVPQYLVVSSTDSDTIADEIDAFQNWARLNNLNLNHNKTQDMVIFKQGIKHIDKIMPAALDGIVRVSSMKIFGVCIDNKLSFSEHLSKF